MKILTFLFFVEVGWLPHSFLAIYDLPESIDQYFGESYYTELGADVFVWNFYAGGGVKTYVRDCYENWSFAPQMAEYSFQLGWRNSWLDFGWRHYCCHPVFPFATFAIADVRWEGAYDEVFIRVTGEIGGKKQSE